MRVLIYIEDVLGIHYATNLELAAKHISCGDQVHFVVCQGDLQSCPANTYHDWKACILCRSKLRVGLSADVLSSVKVHVLNLGKYAQSIDIPDFVSIGELKKFSISGMNHGMEAASSVITTRRDPNPDMVTHRRLVKRNLYTSVALFHAALDLIDEIKPDLCYVLNGRRSSQMPVVRALRAKGIRFYTFEVGHNWRKFILIEGTYFHDLENKKREIERYWSDPVAGSEKERIARKFFHDRRYGSGHEYPEALFKKNQQKGILPRNFDATKRNIAIFNSSEDEFAAVEGYENPVYKDQIDGLREIISSPDIDPDIRFYLRVHPNLSQVTNFQTRAIESLQSANLVVIGAHEDIDSYALMESAEKVLTFGSAMSIESAYAGKPSILIGREPYEDLGACYTPKSHAEALALINDAHLQPLPMLGALKYGYYMVARDIEYRHFDPETNSFYGRTLAPSVRTQRAMKVQRVLAYIINLRWYLKVGLRALVGWDKGNA
jgi:hypothetical protein